MGADRKLSWDWYDGVVPENVVMGEDVFIETAFSFYLFRSEVAEAVRLGRGASTYLGAMFDVGPKGRVNIGEFALIHGARIICDGQIDIGDHALISWNVVLMDTYRMSTDRETRRAALRNVPLKRHWVESQVEPRPIRIGANTWIGFDACILPGVTIGEGSIVGARSVVAQDVPAYTIAAGNPARIIRSIDPSTKARRA
jgi:acetyltransferase-like isoleucine patch superfamily enzyme